MNWDMTVDDVPVCSCKSKAIHDTVYDILSLAELEIIAFLLFVGSLVGNEITFECRHLRFIEERRVFSAPEVKEIVSGIFTNLWVRVLLEGRAHEHADIVKEVFSFVPFTWNHLHILERTIFVQRNRGMEEEISVADGLHATV